MVSFQLTKLPSPGPPYHPPGFLAAHQTSPSVFQSSSEACLMADVVPVFPEHVAPWGARQLATVGSWAGEWLAVWGAGARLPRVLFSGVQNPA